MQKKCLFLLARKYGGHLGHHAIKRDYLEQEDTSLCAQYVVRFEASFVSSIAHQAKTK